MKKVISLALVIFAVLATCNGNIPQEVWLTSAPAGKLFCKIRKSGKTVIPSGRIITPAGKSIIVAPHPYGLALSNDGTTAVTANSGVKPVSVSIIHDINWKIPP